MAKSTKCKAKPSLKELMIQFGRYGLKDVGRAVIISGSKALSAKSVRKFRSSKKTKARDRENFLERLCLWQSC